MLFGLGPRTLTSLALVLALVTGASLMLFGGDEEPKTVAAHFPRAVSIYEGSDVRILGVNVGKVTAVVPAGSSVRVEMEYDAKYRLPADAKAVIVTPTLVADRFVQLTPVYRSGEELPDGAEIALPDTGVPIELDRIYSGLQDLTRALGPNGVNKDGTLNHLLEVAAKNLEGKGVLGNRMLNDLSEAAQTFGQGSGDLFATVTDLARFTQVLARNDELVSAFLQDLAGVSSDLAAERDELAAALAEVAGAVGVVRTFVKKNRSALTTDVKRLTRVAKAFASERASLDKALRAGPVGITNLNIAFDFPSGTIGSRIGIKGNIGDVDGFLCGVVQQLSMSALQKKTACQLFKLLIEPVGEGIASNMSGRSDAGSLTMQAARTQPTYRQDSSSSMADLVGAR